MAFLPKQKLPKKDKDLQWFIDNLEYRLQEVNYFAADVTEMIALYKAANGELDPSYYKKVLNPYNSQEQNLVDFPTDLVDVDIISPIIYEFLGEKANKPFNHQVIVTNSDTDNKFKKEKNEKVRAWIEQEYANKLNQTGVQTGVQTKEQEDLANVLKEYNTNYNDTRAIIGQEAVDYIKYDLDLKHKYQEGMYDWLVVGRVYTFKDVYKNDIVHTIIPPLELRHGTTKTGFIEDADWALRRSRFNVSTLIDKFNSVFTEDDIVKLENEAQLGSTVTTTSVVQGQSYYSIDKASNANNPATPNFYQHLIDVVHCTWKGFVKVGILTYLDEFGMEQEMEVDEDYKLNKDNGDIKIEWEWDSCVYELYKFGKEIYKLNRECLVQRNALNNSSEVKLPYNGFVGYNERNIVRSVVKSLCAYQAEFNICRFRRSLALAKNKDKVLMMPVGIVPSDFGTGSSGMIKYLQFVDSTGIGFFDEKANGMINALNALKSVDLSLGNYIEFYSKMISEIKAEAWDAVGMNRQRYGQVMASDGKAVNQQAVIQSSTITREIFRRFERFEESDLQGLLDCSKLAWIDGKKGMYINSEGRKAFLNIEGTDYMETDFGVFAVDSDEENAKLKTAKDYAFGWAQKGTSSASTVIEVLDSNNIASLKAKIKAIEETEKEYQQQVQEQQQQAAQEIEKMKQENLQAELKNNIDVAMIKAHADAHINAANNEHEANMNDKNANGIPDNGRGESDSVNYAADQKSKYNLQKEKNDIQAYKALNDVRLKEANLELAKKKQQEQNKNKK